MSIKRVKLMINGQAHEVVADENLTLLDLLRDEFRLTGAKQSCDKTGQCGACTVIMNGRAVKSCLYKVAKLDGASVITVEGLGTPENPHLIQEAFVLSGAIQCGYCTPGFIMATKALLDKNNNPSTEEIKKALSGNLCRCTGYVKIIAAVKLAARFIRGEITPDEVRPDPDGPKVGVSHPRPTALAKACGTARFTADYVVPGALEVAVVHSPHAHARIVNIDFSEAEKMPGVIGFLTYKDIKGTNRLVMNTDDRPVLCEDRVRVIGDPVVAVVAECRHQAREAAQKVKVEYELLPVLNTTEEALAEGAIQIHDDRPNLYYTQPQIKGDAGKAFAEAAAVAEGHFKTQINHQSPLEPEASLAYLIEEDGEEKLVVVGRSINIHKHLSVLQDALGFENIRYEEAFSGGQFGMKVEITSEAIAGAAALKFKRPVRYIPSLQESMFISPKRHPYDMKAKLCADKDGYITGYEIDLTVDDGAYHSNGDVIIGRSLRMLSGAYNIPNVQAMSRLVYTNNPWGSSARGAGPPQTNFTLECLVNMLAEKMGIDPLEFRLKNTLQPSLGHSKSTGVVPREWPFPVVCEAIKPHYERAVEEAKKYKDGNIVRGVGIAAASFGVGSAGDKSIVSVELNDDEGVTIYAAVADPGEGNDSMLTQLAAEGLGIPMEKVHLVTRNTDETTATGPAAGSRMTYMCGGALVNAIEQIKQAMKECGAKTFKELKAAGKPTRYNGTKQAEFAGPLDKETGQGPGYESEVHCVQMIELEVNKETGEVKVLKATTAVDSGPVINRLNYEGQLEGGADMGVGYALREEYIAGYTKDWVTFKYPRMKDSFEMVSIITETPRYNGTNGSTGVGEMTMLPTAPAVISAIYDAVGVWVTDLPATPEKIKAALAKR